MEEKSQKPKKTIKKTKQHTYSKLFSFILDNSAMSRDLAVGDARLRDFLPQDTFTCSQVRTPGVKQSSAPHPVGLPRSPGPVLP